jgi:hypothetical protein
MWVVKAATFPEPFLRVVLGDDPGSACPRMAEESPSDGERYWMLSRMR